MTMYRTLFLSFLLSIFTVSAEAKDSGFLFFGDFGTGSDQQKAVASGMKAFCEKHPCEFVVGLGDNFYPAGVENEKDPKWEDYFFKIYSALKLVFNASLGNHDYGGNVPAQIAYSSPQHLWNLPSRYYSFHHNGIDFFALDTNQFEEKQSAWLKKGLESSKAIWKIVYGHHPIYSYGMHGNTPALINDLLPLLKKYKVDFYLAGHEHDKQVLREEGGVNFVISGAAAQTRNVGSGERTVYSDSSLGFAHMAVSASNAVVTFLDRDGTSPKTFSFPKK